MKVGEAPRRILVVRLGAIGDCLRVLPSVVLLRQAFPEAEIGWVVDNHVAPVLRGHPALDRLHVLDRRLYKQGFGSARREFGRVAAELAAAHYDVAIDFHTRLKSGYLAWRSRAPRRIGLGLRSGTEANFLFTNERVTLEDPYESRVMRFARLLAPLGLSPRADDLPLGTAVLGVSAAEAARAAQLHGGAGSPAVALYPGSSAARAADRWPVEKWQALVRLLAAQGVGSMVLWGPGEEDLARAVVAGAGAAAGVSVTLAPPTTLREMMALAGRFRAYAGSNTAALHMAWMQGVPSVVLVGGRPWRTDRPLARVPSAMLSAGGLQPSRKLRGKARRDAIEGVAVEDVAAALGNVLGWSAPRA